MHLIHRIARGCAVAPIVSTFSFLLNHFHPVMCIRTLALSCLCYTLIPDVEVFSRKALSVHYIKYIG
jgi:hypothetical protein